MAEIGNPFAAEPNVERRLGRVQAKANFTAGEAAAFDLEVRRRCEHMASAEQPTDNGAEVLWGDTIDFVNVAFLTKGAQAC